ncbi:hypothetical protein PG991_003572 [Apiospora marii]|uniref:Uncharacterized protein n=1 Tax=Apiospora marii TaxID=335849 RepID=A0ABR1S3Y6_9PEZI
MMSRYQAPSGQDMYKAFIPMIPREVLPPRIKGHYGRRAGSPRAHPDHDTPATVWTIDPSAAQENRPPREKARSGTT